MNTWIRTIIDSDRYALRELPPSQRFQIMTTLSLMWTAIFCAATGAWLWYGQIAVAHVLVALGLVATSVTFRSAKRTRALFQPGDSDNGRIECEVFARVEALLAVLVAIIVSTGAVTAMRSAKALKQSRPYLRQLRLLG